MNLIFFTMDDVRVSRASFEDGEQYAYFAAEPWSFADAVTQHILTKGTMIGEGVTRTMGYMSKDDHTPLEARNYWRMSVGESEFWCIFRPSHPDFAHSVDTVWLHPGDTQELTRTNIFIARGTVQILGQDFTGPLHLELTQPRSVIANDDVFLFMWD